MTIERPTGGRRPEMTVPPSAWPEINEVVLLEQTQLLVKSRTELEGQIAVWNRVQTSLFDRRTWSGGAASVAKAQLIARVA
jgi:hypothetical protein